MLISLWLCILLELFGVFNLRFGKARHLKKVGIREIRYSPRENINWVNRKLPGVSLGEEAREFWLREVRGVTFPNRNAPRFRFLIAFPTHPFTLPAHSL